MPTGDREITLRFLAAPTDAGYSGNVSGGSVLEWIDKAGYACAIGWSGRYCVTAYVGDVRFSTPVRVGHLVEATGRLLHTGRSSMQVLVTVSSGDPADRVLREATPCLMVFVAVDDAGKPCRSRRGIRPTRWTSSSRPTWSGGSRCGPRSRTRWPPSPTPRRAPRRRSACASWPRRPT